MDAAVDHLHQVIEDFDSRPGIALRQDACAQNHHRAGLGNRKRSTYSNRVTSHQIELKQLQFVVGNSDVGESAETSVDAIYGLTGFENVFNHSAARLDFLNDAGRKADGLKIIGCGCQLSQRKRTCTDEDHSRIIARQLYPPKLEVPQHKTDILNS